MSKPSKKSYNQKVDFSDQEAYEDIIDQIEEIKQSNMKKVEAELKIYDLYTAQKQERRKQKFINNNKVDKNPIDIGVVKQRQSSDEEEGQIPQKPQQFIDFFAVGDFEAVPSISNLGDHIRPLTLTRNRIVDLLNTRRFQELMKGCFVRYLIDTNMNSNNNSYIIAQIVGVTEGNKEYSVNNIKTKVLLKLQETSQNVVTLSLQLISNQSPPGGLEIQKWLQTNRNKIPKEKQLKEKLEEHNKLLVEQLSSGEIDSNIWKKAKRIAEKLQQPKEDLNTSIDFVSEKLSNLQIQIEEQKIGRNAKGDLNKLEKEIGEVKTVLQSLNQIKEEILKNRKIEKAEEPKKQRKFEIPIIEEKRRDEINQNVKSKMIQLSTYDGYVKLRKIVQQTHMKFNVDLEEEDIAY